MQQEMKCLQSVKNNSMFLHKLSFSHKYVFPFQNYDETEVLKAKLDILSKTNMIDYAIDIRKQLYPRDEVPEDLKQRRQHVVAQLQELQQVVEPILQIMANEDIMKNMENLRDSKTLIAYLEKEVRVSEFFRFIILYHTTLCWVEKAQFDFYALKIKGVIESKIQEDHFLQFIFLFNVLTYFVSANFSGYLQINSLIKQGIGASHKFCIWKIQ